MAQPEFMSGMLRVLILNELSCGVGYGYGIAKGIARRSGGELTVRPESLYPVLHRMENEKLVSVSWEHAENGRPRKMYKLTAKGKRQWDKARPKFIAMSAGALKAIGAEPAGDAS